MWVFHLYQIWDLLSLVVKYLIILWFFQPLGRRTEGKWIKAGCFCLLPMAWLYLSPPAALVNLYSLENFSIQMERMLVHWLSIGVFLVLTREISRPAAGYLSGIVTVIFLAVQNFRSAATVFFPLLGSNEANRRFTLCVVIIIEFCILKILRSAIDITKIKSINISSWSTLILSLLLEVYFKWTLLFMQFQAGLMLHREFALFAFCAAFGVMLVLLLTEVNQQVMVEKNRIKTEQVRLGYEMQNAKRSLQFNRDIRRLYHDMKNHLLAIQSMAEEQAELRDYLSQLLPRFEGYDDQVSTGNSSIDGMLSQKIQRSRLDSIQFNICLDLTEYSFVQSVDLITIFGNALDNAVEAVLSLPEDRRIIYLKSAKFANMLILRFSNQFEGTIFQENGHIVTRKDNPQMHGIGLDNIKSAARRYGGSATVEIDQVKGWFRLMVMFPIP